MAPSPVRRRDHRDASQWPQQLTECSTIPISVWRSEYGTLTNPSLPEQEASAMLDLVIKNGMVIDGSGLPRYRADVGVKHGKITTIGRISELARETIDADGHVVTPG